MLKIIFYLKIIKINKMETKIKNIPIGTTQIIKRHLGAFATTSGVNKYFALLNATDTLEACMNQELVIEEINKELEKLKDYEEKTGNPTIYKHVKSWKNIYKLLSYLRPLIADAQLEYDLFQSKKKVGRKDIDESRLRQVTKKISPYQPQLHFLLNTLLNLSNISWQTIPNECFKSDDVSNITKSTFTREKPKPKTEDVLWKF